MTAFTSRFRLFRTVASLGLPLLTWLLLPTEAVSAPLQQTLQLVAAVDNQRTVEVPHPRGHNPLTSSENNRGKQIADASDLVKRARARAASRSRPPGTERLAAVQLLYAQRHDDKNAPGARKAEVRYFDYTTSESIRAVVDLNSNTVQETQVLRGVANQSFTTGLETETVLQLILNDPQQGPRLRKAFLETMGRPLDNVSQLNADSGIFFPDSVAGTPLGAVTVGCAQDRCIQIFPIGDTGIIDMSKVVVDLTTGKVLSDGEGIIWQTR